MERLLAAVVKLTKLSHGGLETVDQSVTRVDAVNRELMENNTESTINFFLKLYFNIHVHIGITTYNLYRDRKLRSIDHRQCIT